MTIQVGLVDDHQLFLKSLSLMVESFSGCRVVLEALNGVDMKAKLAALPQPPDVMLLDVNMPVMDGVATAVWLSEHCPSTKLIALTMNDRDDSIISMFRAGCFAYLLKDLHPSELELAIREVVEKGYYNADAANVNFRRLLLKSEERSSLVLTPREQEFLQYACSEMTYKEVASKMNLAERTVDGYREALFQKFNVQSRVGLCLEALRKGFVTL